MVLAGCSGRADERLLHQAGIRADLTCLDAEGIDRTSFCGGTFSTGEAEAASKTFALQLLERPEKHGKVTNFMNLPFECRVLLFDNPRAMDLTGVFDAPMRFTSRPPDSNTPRWSWLAMIPRVKAASRWSVTSTDELGGSAV